MIAKPPGVEDIFPDRIDRWNHIITTAKTVFDLYNYREIVIPVMEFTEVFSRGLGDETDIVSKEMFTFEDRGKRSLTLRPEGTASVVRAYVENGEYNRLSSCKFCYSGPMFRAERPQKGRLRQFNQFGAEFFGSGDPYYDFEVIAIMDTIAKKLGISGYALLVNSIGCPECRKTFIEDLTAYYQGKKEQLCDDCKRRLTKNPLRLLDCKNAGCIALKAGAPVITSYLCGGCAEHFTSVKRHLDTHDIAYTSDPLLVRGLDYYTRTTFEFVTETDSGQNAFAAGGRYDNLVSVFGGKETPAVGFAAGIERIFLLTETNDIQQRTLDTFIIYSGDAARTEALKTAALLRSQGISSELDPESRGFKAQFKKADREKADTVIIFGDDEIAGGLATVKDMKTGEQKSIAITELIGYLTESKLR